MRTIGVRDAPVSLAGTARRNTSFSSFRVAKGSLRPLPKLLRNSSRSCLAHGQYRISRRSFTCGVPKLELGNEKKGFLENHLAFFLGALERLWG